MAAYSLADTNLFAYCRNNPVMYTDRAGNAPTWWQLTISLTMVCAGLILTASGVGGILGGILISAGANSIIAGYVNESYGGSYTGGWCGGLIIGAGCGTGAGLAGKLMLLASESVGLPALGYLGAGLFSSYMGGATGCFAGAYVTSLFDNTYFDTRQNLIKSQYGGIVNVLAGYGSGLTNAIHSVGGSVGACAITTLGFSLGAEFVCDFFAYAPDIIHNSPMYITSRSPSINIYSGALRG